MRVKLGSLKRQDTMTGQYSVLEQDIPGNPKLGHILKPIVLLLKVSKRFGLYTKSRGSMTKIRRQIQKTLKNKLAVIISH